MISRCILSLLSCLLTLICTPAVGANGSAQLEAAIRFLPVHQAFQFTATETSDSVLVRIEAAPGYYLYKSRLSFSIEGGEVTAGPPVLPAGEDKSDPYFGDVVVYHGTIDARLPVQNRSDRGFRVNVKFQGCAEKGLCYPPDTQALEIGGTAGAAAAAHWNWVDLLHAAGTGAGTIFSSNTLPLIPIFAALVLISRSGTRRAFALWFTFAMPMASTFAALGLATARYGASINLQAVIQSPWSVTAIVCIFLALAWQTARLPSARMNGVSGFLTAAMLGIVCSAVVAPSLSGPGAGTLQYIGASGDVLGGSLLLALCLGMALPLLTLCGSAVLLRTSGPGAAWARRTVSFATVWVAVGVLGRVIPDVITLGLVGLLAVSAAALLWQSQGLRRGLPTGRGGIAVLLLAYGVAAWCGMLKGEGSPTHPLGQLPFSGTPPAPSWLTVNSPAQLSRALADARVAGKPAVVEWTAGWCAACKELEQGAFAQPSTVSALQGFQTIRVDVTADGQEQRKLLELNGLFGPPALQLIREDGTEATGKRMTGVIDTKRLLPDLQSVSSH